MECLAWLELIFMRLTKQIPIQKWSLGFQKTHVKKMLMTNECMYEFEQTWLSQLKKSQCLKHEIRFFLDRNLKVAFHLWRHRRSRVTQHRQQHLREQWHHLEQRLQLMTTTRTSSTFKIRLPSQLSAAKVETFVSKRRPKLWHSTIQWMSKSYSLSIWK